MFIEIRKHLDRLPKRKQFDAAKWVLACASYNLNPNQKRQFIEKLNEDYEKTLLLISELADQLGKDERLSLSEITEDMVHRELGEPEMFGVHSY